MHLAKAIGTVVSTNKVYSPSGPKLSVVAKLIEELQPDGMAEMAVDSVGTGNEEIVIVTTNSSVRRISGLRDTVIDSAIVGTVDTVETVENRKG